MKKAIIGIAGIAVLAVLPLSAQQTRVLPPAPAAPRTVTIPQPVEKTLANGLRVIAIEKKGLPLVAARLMVRTGGEADPASLGGLAEMTGSLLTKGTATLSAEQIARDVEALGATLESGAGWDNSYVALSALSTNFGRAMGYMADVAIHPTFKQDELDRLRTQNIDALRVAMGDPESLSSFVASRVLFGGTPYGHNLGGTPLSLSRITRSDVLAFHAKYYRPGNAVLVVAGDVTADEVFAAAAKLFGGWKGGAVEGAATIPSPASPPGNASPAKARVVVVDMPGAGQASVMLLHRGIRRSDPAFITSQVTNMILGGDYSSRLNQEVRIKRGLSYGAGSSFDARREPGPFLASAQTKNESAVEVAQIIGGEISKMSSAPVAPAELTPRKANLVGRFGRAIETTAGLVSRVGALALYGLPLDGLNHYIGDVQAVSPEDIQKFAAATWSTPPDVVIVGDVRKFGDAFGKAFPSAEVIPVSKLDLDSPTLTE